MYILPYLTFDGRCEEAVEFYKTALGAEDVQVHRYRGSPAAGMASPEKQDKVMHASFRVGGSVIMASDGQCTGSPSFQGFSLSLNLKSEDEADRFFSALSDGGQVRVPLTKTFFSPKFGIVSDRFGVSWMIHVGP